MSRIAVLLLCALVALPAASRLLPARARRPCAPEGRGVPPRHWIGCAGDPGPRRDLDGAERLALGLPLDLNRATAADLAGVPGLSARLGEAVLADRERIGPFERVDDLLRVHGVGPARLARARDSLVVGPAGRR